MIDMTPEQENDLIHRYGILIEKDWTHPELYQATMSRGWIHVVTTATTKTEAVYNLKKHIVSEVTWLNPDLTTEHSFEQYMMYKKLGV
jgi:hypothetical protein